MRRVQLNQMWAASNWHMSRHPVAALVAGLLLAASCLATTPPAKGAHAKAKKTKTRVKEEKKHTVSGVRSAVAAVPAEKAVPAAEKPPRTESYEARPMFDEDAPNVFDRGRKEVLAYRDPSDDGIRFLYRRKDGTVVLRRA